MTKYRTYNHITQNTKHITVLNRNTEWMTMRGFTHNTHYTEHTKTKVTESYRIHRMHTKNHPYAQSQNTHTTQNNRFINAEKKSTKIHRILKLWFFCKDIPTNTQNHKACVKKKNRDWQKKEIIPGVSWDTIRVRVWKKEGLVC